MNECVACAHGFRSCGRSLQEAVRSAGLGEFPRVEEAARPLAGTGQGRSSAKTTQTAPVLRIALLGRPTDFISQGGQSGPVSSIFWTPVPPTSFPGRARDWLIITAAIATPPLAYGLVRLTERQGRWGLLALTVPLAALVVAGGPWMLCLGTVSRPWVGRPPQEADRLAAVGHPGSFLRWTTAGSRHAVPGFVGRIGDSGQGHSTAELVGRRVAVFCVYHPR